MFKARIAASLIAIASAHAYADIAHPAAVAVTQAPQPEPTEPAGLAPVVVAPLPPQPERPVVRHRARFSGARMFVESLAGTVVGSLAGYGMYRATGGDIGGALLGLGANIAVTPLAVYATGRAMGGEGTVGASYYGGLFGLTAPGTAATSANFELTLAIGVIIMPITSALFYEVSSNTRSKQLETVVSGLSISPIGGSSGVSGLRADLAFPF